MTGDRKTNSARRAGKDVPQFAPNFTVYVLPPDVVCLYSEDRKFFLHGELYCALASAIGKGGKSLPQLVRELGQRFPPDKVEEALKRLIERRYIVPASPSSAGAVAGYWASLGLPPGMAEQNLGNCRVRVESIDVQGAAEFGAALSELGVRVVKRVARPDGHAGERLSRTTAGRIEPAAGIGPDALAAGAALRRLSAGGTGVQPGRGRLLDLPVRSHDPEPRGQGISRPRTGARRRRFAARAQHARTRRHPVCRPRSRQGDRYRLSHRVERSHHQS